MHTPVMAVFKKHCLLVSPVEYLCPDAIVFLCGVCSTNEEDYRAVVTGC